MRKSGKKWQKRIALLLFAFSMLGSVLGGGPMSLTSYALTSEEKAWVEEASNALRQIADDGDIMAVVYMSAIYPVRTEASFDSEVVLEVPSGQTVLIQDVWMDEDYRAWEYVTLYYQGNEYSGYIPREYLACSDERFLAWEEQYGMNPGAYATYTVDEAGNANEENAEQENTETGNTELENTKPVYPDIEQFPESYQPALEVLKAQHPNWIFVPMNTGLDWEEVIANEIVGGKSLVGKNYPEYTKEGVYDGGSWFYASEDILKLYMDPRNSLTEDAIFQFEQLTYNETYHTEEALELFLQNTFMKGDKYAPGTKMKFSLIIWALGKDRQVSPFHLAARIYQEQGQGNSPLISGTYPGYEGYYNYFNIKASGKTNQEVIENGLKHAKEKNWYSAYFSIEGGTDVIAANYIKKGQDTLYLQKYNVNPGGAYALYTHQYMQNIAAPTSEAKSIRNLYRNADALDSPFVFKIPVYENMPETACPMPTSSDKVVIQIPEGYDTTVYVDGVPKEAENRNGRWIVSAGDGNGQSAVVYQYNESGVPVGMYTWTLDYKDGSYMETTQPELADLLTYHGFSIRITGKSGIRFKTGVSESLRGKLLGEGVDGYRLKEYGTLVMNHANIGNYPMIKGGEKVLVGKSYGMEADGTLTDKIYETVNERHRYTSVLVGLPADQYKVEYAFRGYMVLEKDGQEKIVYGPVVAKSIYSLAQQVLDAGTYTPGSDADVFLRQLIADADALEQGANETTEESVPEKDTTTETVPGEDVTEEQPQEDAA